MSFVPVDANLLFSRNDAQDIRLGDVARLLPPTSAPAELSATLEEAISTETANARHYVIAGYPDDEGIRINGGRLGAMLAPNAVRKPLYKMTPALQMQSADPAGTKLWDLGNLQVNDRALAERHQTVAEFAQACLTEGACWIGIGGGHDYGFADAQGFIEWCKHAARTNQQARPLIINFDAHLDVRSPERGLSSGTPFYRMLERYPDVDFAEIGIQGHCNSRTHLEWVRSKGARVLTQEDVENSGVSLVVNFTRLMSDWLLKPRPVFLSVDIDGFSSAIAPGCSQSWATGFCATDFFPCLDLIKARLEIKLLGIYEVSPPLDHDDRTAKLAAQIIHRVIS